MDILPRNLRNISECDMWYNPDMGRNKTQSAKAKVAEEVARLNAAIPRWGYCVVCLKERKLVRPSRKVTTHRRFVKFPVITDGAVGEMIPCTGSGMYPLK